MNKLNRDEIITKPEVESLIDSLVTDAEFHPYAIYGLMFLFSSIRKLAENGDNSLLEQIWTDALIKLYSVSENVYEAIDRTTENIHLHYRAADFKADDYSEIAAPFLASECAESVKTENILDLSAQPAECQRLNSLANQLSDIMKNPNLPTHLYNVLTDELAVIEVSTDSPENILLNLKKQIEAEKNPADE